MFKNIKFEIFFNSIVFNEFPLLIWTARSLLILSLTFSDWNNSIRFISCLKITKTKIKNDRENKLNGIFKNK